MPLSPPKPRQHLHTRDIDLRGYHREDGLMDIEVHFSDQKTYTYDFPRGGTIAAGQPVHNMSMRLSIDAEMTVREVEVVMDARPYDICSEILDNFQKLIGLSIGPGWSKRVREVVGGVDGCTHLGELLAPIATVAFQTISGDYPRQLMGLEPLRDQAQQDGTQNKPFMLNGCHAWSASSPIVREDYPDYYQAPEVEVVNILNTGE